MKDSHHGFRNRRKPGTALTAIYKTAAHHTAQNDQCYLVLRSVSKAFDKVWIEELQFKIAHLDLPNISKIFLNNFP